jgi:hypothetical protein
MSAWHFKIDPKPVTSGPDGLQKIINTIAITAPKDFTYAAETLRWLITDDLGAEPRGVDDFVSLWRAISNGTAEDGITGTTGNVTDETLTDGIVTIEPLIDEFAHLFPTVTMPKQEHLDFLEQYATFIHTVYLPAIKAQRGDG